MHGAQAWVWELGWAQVSLSYLTFVSVWLVCQVSNHSRTRKEMWHPYSTGGEGKPRAWWEGETGSQREKARQGMPILFYLFISPIGYQTTKHLDLIDCALRIWPHLNVHLQDMPQKALLRQWRSAINSRWMTMGAPRCVSFLQSSTPSFTAFSQVGINLI